MIITLVPYKTLVRIDRITLFVSLYLVFLANYFEKLLTYNK